MEGADAGLTGTLLNMVVDGDRSGGLAVADGDRRRGSMVDIKDGLERLVGERQIT